MQSGSKKRVDVPRLKADVTAAGVEILSAHCAADRIRLQYSPEDVVTFGERTALKKAIASSQAIYRYFALIELQLKRTDDSDR
jgi:hypothetical protein